MSPPRFDSIGVSVLNLVGIAVWLIVIFRLFRRHRAGDRITALGVVAVPLNISIDGVFVPLGPMLWLLDDGVRRRGGRVKDIHSSASP